MKKFKWENNKLVTSIFRNKMSSGVYTNFISFIPLEYKFGLVHTFLSCCFNLSSDFLKFHHEVGRLKNILLKKVYPKKFIDKCIQKFLNNMFIRRSQIPTVPKKELIIIFLYLGKMSCIVKTRLRLWISTWNFVHWELFSKLMIHSETIFASKILFLKHYSKVWFTNSCVEAAQPPTLVRPIDFSK